jgi:hypothetical protein
VQRPQGLAHREQQLDQGQRQLGTGGGIAAIDSTATLTSTSTSWTSREEATTNPTKLTAKQREEVTFATRGEIGRTLLPAVSVDARSVFEDAGGVEYPVGPVGVIVTPFDRLIDWIATGNA